MGLQKKDLREKGFRDDVDIYIIGSCRTADAVVKIWNGNLGSSN